MQHDQFTLLRLDIDDTVLNADDIALKLDNESLQSFLIHTTASHQYQETVSTGKAIDKPDFIAIREFEGNRTEAIKYIAKTYFPVVHSHNLKEWKINRLNGGKQNEQKHTTK